MVPSRFPAYGAFRRQQYHTWSNKTFLCSERCGTFTNVYYNGIDPEPEFRLSHYGLPEPQGVTWPKPTPWYIYFIGVGVGVWAWERSSAGDCTGESALTYRRQNDLR